MSATAASIPVKNLIQISLKGWRLGLYNHHNGTRRERHGSISTIAVGAERSDPLPRCCATDFQRGQKTKSRSLTTFGMTFLREGAKAGWAGFPQGGLSSGRAFLT
jgi:hypothetical protein